ncbi:hypothetical protein ACLB2K_058665 [Fragaria x ananassa]
MADEGKKPNTVIQQLYDVLHSEHMRPYVSWNNDDSNPFTFHRNEDDFRTAISSNFSAVSNYDALRRRLVCFGFGSNGTEYWHTDSLFCKGKPELPLQIGEKKPVQAHPPRPHLYSQEDKIDAMSLSKREAGYLDPSYLWTAKTQHREESSNCSSEAHAPVLTHPSGVCIPDWSRPPGNRYILLVILKEEMVQELIVYEKRKKAASLERRQYVIFSYTSQPTRSFLFQHSGRKEPSSFKSYPSFSDFHLSTHPSLNIPHPLKSLTGVELQSTSTNFTYEKGSYLFGKLPDCDFQLQHKFNSRKHACKAAFKPTGEAYIYDISYLGTFINKNKVLKNDYTELKIGNWISFGDPTRSYLFKDSSEEEPSKPIGVADVHVSTLPPVDLPLPIEIPD